MAGTQFEVSTAGLGDALRRIEGLLGFERAELLERAGAVVESQTRRRISDEKTGPDGERWPAWSESYSATRRGGQSLLIGEGDMLDSIASVLDGNQSLVGTNKIQAALQHFGGEEVDINVPARPFLGLSDDNVKELSAVIEGYLNEVAA